ncbi:MAG: hypothetical protein C5S46_03710, partial [Candidatus Methanomarinus sp.]
EEGKLIVSDEVLGVSYGTKGKSMSLGTGTELSGDEKKSAFSLAKTENTDPLGWFKMIILASTNINHFFPLAAKEWGKHHQKAKTTALAARAAYKNDKDMGDKLTEMALQLEAFGLHFLQDSYAAGHQYPRALHMVSEEDRGILKASGLYGLKEAKYNYHDELNKISDGIDLEVGGKFHGDDTADSRDNRIAIETYNSLVEVLSTIAGINPTEVGGEPPRPNNGPDVDKIMQDPAGQRPLVLAGALSP